MGRSGLYGDWWHQPACSLFGGPASCLPVWGAAFAGYSAAIQSPKQVGELLNQATLACLGLALVVMLFYGEASCDEWDNEVSEGFETTFDSKAGAGMRAFFKLIIGSSAGILLAEALSSRQEK